MLIKSVGVGWAHDKDFVIDRPNDISDSTCVIVKTNALFVIDGKEIHTPPNTVIFFKSGTPQYFGADNDVYIDDWIHYDMEDGEFEIFEKFGIALNTPIELSSFLQLSQIMMEMHRERISRSKHKELSQKNLKATRLGGFYYFCFSRSASSIIISLTFIRRDKLPRSFSSSFIVI